jgi:hypothetical protein
MSSAIDGAPAGGQHARPPEVSSALTLVPIVVAIGDAAKMAGYPCGVLCRRSSDQVPTGTSVQ